MRPVTETQYQKLAEAIATDFVSASIPLNESVQKTAESFDMNHEQIKRLCEATNNVTFNKLFNSRDKTAADRVIEFDICDPRTVLANMIKRFPSDGEKTATLHVSEFLDLPDYMHDVRHPEDFVKEASVEGTYELPEVETGRSKEKTNRTLRKLGEYLSSERVGLIQQAEEVKTALCGRFKLIYNDETFESFEKKAAATHGLKANEVLNGLRIKLGKTEVNYNNSVLQKTAGIIDDTTEEMKLFGHLMGCLTKVANINDALTEIQKSGVNLG